MHQAVNPNPQQDISDLSYIQGANNMGFYHAQGPSQPASQSGAVMGYYAANDIPYHWALASNFALCDQYFCSVLSGTGPNRMYLVGGTILPSDPSTAPSGPPVDNVYPSDDSPATFPPVINNVNSAGLLALVGSADPDGRQPDIISQQYNCPNYVAALQDPNEEQTHPIYRVYDDWNWSWGGAEGTPGTDGTYGDLDVFYYYQPVGGVQLGADGVPNTSTADPHYFAANDTVRGLPGDSRPLFAQHVKPSDGSRPVLAKVTWILPPWNYCEHPDNASTQKSADGARYLSQIIDALIASKFWDDTVLVVTYDETDTHFDHVVPPLATPDEEPWVNNSGSAFPLGYAAPIGAGMRVPAIIVSPWTYGAGVIHDTMDHTSLLQLAETVTGVNCAALPPVPGGWRRTNFLNLGDVINGLNRQPASADKINTDRSSPTGLPTSETAEAWAIYAQARYNNNSNAPQAPVPQSFPPIVQSCGIRVGSYDLAQAKEMAGGQPTATFAGALTVTVYGFEPDELLNGDALGQRINNVSSTSGPCTTRVPTVTLSNPNISAVPSAIFVDPNPNNATTVSGVPYVPGFTFSYDLVFSNFSEIFPPLSEPGTPGVTNTYVVTAVFQVDATFTASANLELVSTQGIVPTPCETLLQNWSALEPKTNPVLLEYYAEKLSACQGPKYTAAVKEIRELLAALENPPSP
jgi:hypothetical protein